MRCLTNNQLELLNICKSYTSVNCPIKYDVLKSLCDYKSFDSTFNALLWQGYFERFETNDYSNQFTMTDKFDKYCS